MFSISIIAIVFICVAMTFKRGLWKNLITFVNTVFAALLAMNYFEPLAEYLKGQSIKLDFMWDIMCLWGVFVVAMLVLRLITDRLAQGKVRFIKPVDIGGGVFFSLWTGWILACLTGVSFHVAPLPRDAVESSPAASDLPLSADRLWLGFTQAQSCAALGRVDATNEQLSKPELAAQAWLGEGPLAYMFDPKGDFLLRYANSRRRLELLKSKTEQGNVFLFTNGRNELP